MKEFKFVTLRDKPEIEDTAAIWFCSKWCETANCQRS